MNRRKFLGYIGCGCCSMLVHSCTTAPITDRKQLKLIPEHKLNRQAAQIYRNVQKKTKLSNDKKQLNEIKEIGAKIENHNYFPEKCNVTLANIKNKKHIKVKVWERGAGLTKACGTAACATAVAGSLLKLTDRIVDIEFPEGSLNIDWKSNNNIYMTGKVSPIQKIMINV